MILLSIIMHGVDMTESKNACDIVGGWIQVEEILEGLFKGLGYLISNFTHLGAF